MSRGDRGGRGGQASLWWPLAVGFFGARSAPVLPFPPRSLRPPRESFFSRGSHTGEMTQPDFPFVQYGKRKLKAYPFGAGSATAGEEHDAPQKNRPRCPGGRRTCVRSHASGRSETFLPVVLRPWPFHARPLLLADRNELCGPARLAPGLVGQSLGMGQAGHAPALAGRTLALGMSGTPGRTHRAWLTQGPLCVDDA